MREYSARWIRVFALLGSIALTALAAELLVITNAQIARLAQQFGPIARERLTGWKEILARRARTSQRPLRALTASS